MGFCIDFDTRNIFLITVGCADARYPRYTSYTTSFLHKADHSPVHAVIASCVLISLRMRPFTFFATISLVSRAAFAV